MTGREVVLTFLNNSHLTQKYSSKLLVYTSLTFILNLFSLSRSDSENKFL